MAELTLERVKRLDPYGFYGTNADNLLHLGQGEAPVYTAVLPTAPPGGVGAELRARTQAHPTTRRPGSRLAAALESGGNRRAAMAAAKRLGRSTPAPSPRGWRWHVLGFDKPIPPHALAGLVRALTPRPATRRRGAASTSACCSSG